MFLSAKIDKNIQFNSLFLGIPKIFLYVRVKQVAFFIWEKVVCLKQCPVYGFPFRDVWEGSIWKTDVMKCLCLPKLNKVAALEHDQFIQALVTAHCLIILCKYFSLSYRRPLQCSKLNTYQPVSLLQLFK